ncbi:MAG: putative tellurite resistance protein B-like protein [Pseudorhodobacter sp.]|jgi:uncharacterized tellurite resistance protein B-like protein
MLDGILAMFSQVKGYRTKLPKADVTTALGALLVRVAKADNIYLFQEIEQIDKILAARNGLNKLQAAKLRAQCEKLEKAMPVTAEIIEVFGEVVDIADREAMVAALWQVVFADGYEDQAEDDLLHVIENALGVDPSVSAKLREAAAQNAPKLA